MKVERIFDLLQGYRTHYRMNDALAGKVNGEWKKVSSTDYVERAEDFACGLLALGYKKGDKIAMVFNNRPEWNIIDMGMAQIGVISVPIHTTFGCSKYITILEHCEPKAIIVSDKILLQKMKSGIAKVSSIEQVYTFVQNNPASWTEIISLGQQNKQKYFPELEKIRDSIKPDDILTLAYTLGTIGQPKGVMLSHRNIVSNFLATAVRNPLGFGKRALSFLPLSHVYERMMNYHYQYLGISIYYAENAGSLMANMKEVRPHIFNTVPFFLEKFFDKLMGHGKDLRLRDKIVFFWAVNRVGMRYNPGSRPKWNIFYRFSLWLSRKLVFKKWRDAFGGKIRYIISGGSPLQERLTRIYGAAGIIICEGYGLTETSPVISVSNPLRNKVKPGTVGVVLDDVQIRFAADGELLCKGPNVMQGYYHDSEETSHVIDKDGWFHTGDVGELVDGEYLVILDRKRDIFKLAYGSVIMPQPLERKLRESLFIDHVMLVGEGKDYVAAIVSPNFTFLHKWASLHKIDFSSNEDLIQQQDVYYRFVAEIDDFNDKLPLSNQIKRFCLVGDEWTPQTEELSPAFKLRRHYIINKYKKEIKALYRDPVEMPFFTGD